MYLFFLPISMHVLLFNKFLQIIMEILIINIKSRGVIKEN